MAVFGFLLLALGIGLGWSGFKRVNFIDVLKSLIGPEKPVTHA